MAKTKKKRTNKYDEKLIVPNSSFKEAFQIVKKNKEDKGSKKKEN